MHIQSTFRVNQPTKTAGAGVSDLLTAMQPAAVTFYPADAVIYAQGEEAGPIYLVEFGTVRICRLTADWQAPDQCLPRGRRGFRLRGRP